jgi:hypothetical protein
MVSKTALRDFEMVPGYFFLAIQPPERGWCHRNSLLNLVFVKSKIVYLSMDKCHSAYALSRLNFSFGHKCINVISQKTQIYIIGL